MTYLTGPRNTERIDRMVRDFAVIDAQIAKEDADRLKDSAYRAYVSKPWPQERSK